MFQKLINNSQIFEWYIKIIAMEIPQFVPFSSKFYLRKPTEQFFFDNHDKFEAELI